MTLREQFEKETGESPHLLNLNEGELCKPAYVIWLEQQIPIREQAAQEDIEFRNKLTDLVCDKLLNHNPAGRFAGKKMDECADLIKKGRKLTSPNQVFPSDIEIMEEAISHARYGVEYKRDIELQVNIANFIKTKIYG